MLLLLMENLALMSLPHLHQRVPQPLEQPGDLHLGASPDSHTLVIIVLQQAGYPPDPNHLG